MIKIEKIQQDINNLPEEAQLLLIDFIQLVTLHTLTFVECRLQAEIILLELPLWYSFFPTTAFYSEEHAQPHFGNYSTSLAIHPTPV